MADTGALFYDNPANFEIYMERRVQASSANNSIELPIIRDLLSEVKHLDILDLGCGDASLAKELVEEKKAKSYLGIDGSSNMIQLALKNQKKPIIQVKQGFIEDQDNYPEESYDIIMSRLAFHYIESIDEIFLMIFKALRHNGSFIFSVEHPVITSHQVSIKQGSNRQDWTVDRYFMTGKRQLKWLGGEVIKYHRTIEDYFQCLKKAGFIVEELRESVPQANNIKDKKLFERRSRVPLYLFLKAKKY